jgi:hypothetical protein
MLTGRAYGKTGTKMRPFGWTAAPEVGTAVTAPVVRLIAPREFGVVQVAGALLALHGVTAVSMLSVFMG